MKTHALLAVATLAAALSATARAGEADYASNNQPFDGQRSRAEVQSEAVRAAHNVNPEPNGSRVAAALQSPASKQDVRAEAIQALRQGRIAHGEAEI